MKKIKRYFRRKIKYWLILAAIMPILVPHISLAQSFPLPLVHDSGSIVNSAFWPDYDSRFDSQPAKRQRYVVATAYNSEIGQTDATPFITASGATTAEGIIAANFLPFGTRVRFPDLYGQRVFTVEDRMNPRYQSRVDIWMAGKTEAIKFGVKYVRLEVL